MPDRPTGTVTFLFTDIERSTQLLRALGPDQYSQALQDHRQLLREVFVRHGGYEVDTQGDAFFVAFSRAQDAIRAAGEAQRALGGHPLQDGHTFTVRMGVHTCEARAVTEGYVGVGVHRGARICAAGHGGQVLLSHTTYDLIQEEDTGFGVLDLGEHRLKDLTEPHRLFQLVDPSLPRDFPPLKTLENRPTNLPIQATPFIGREHDIAQLAGLLRRDGIRLVTLTGPGGTGKTRLALQTAAELVEEFPNGVFVVTLAAITNPDLVVSTIAQTLGLKEDAGQPLSAYLAAKKLLLVVDNMEQVIAGAAQLAELLAGAPDVTLLVTSREPLRIAAEHVYPVPGLDLPDPHRLPELSALSEYEAVALFLERAQAAEPSFEVTTANAPAVAEICVRLDGLPLALELAAARISLLSPDAILKRLDDRLKLLRSGGRDAPARQQTLRATLAWSYDLLNESERQLFAQLGVFAGGFTMEAAEEVCDAELDTLASLVDKSLIRRDGERFALLETIHEFALEKLEASSGAAKIRRRHAEYYLALAQSANLMVEAQGEMHHDIVIQDRDNVRGALEWARECGEIEFGLELAATLENYWTTNSPFEGMHWLSELLERAGDGLRGELRARALRVNGAAALISGHFEDGWRCYEASLAEYRRIGDDRGIGIMLQRLAARKLRSDGPKAARSLLEESLCLHRKIGFTKGEASSLGTLAQVELQDGHQDVAFQLFERSASLAAKTGFTWWRAIMLLNLSELLLERGRMVESKASLLEALGLASTMRDRLHTIRALALLARLAGDAGHPKQAGRLWGAIEAEEARALVGQWESEREEYGQLILAHAGPEFECGRREGARLSLSEAVEKALNAPDGDTMSGGEMQ